MHRVEQWEIFEVTLSGPDSGNPFIDVTLTSDFVVGHRSVSVDGFYDGDGLYKVRFMADTIGQWSYRTVSNVDSLDGQSGSFECVVASESNHGPVHVTQKIHFNYADGTPYYPVGTTCYVWNHQGEELEETTLQTLSHAPFNKMRMCVFPKDYDFNKNEPEYYPFEGTALKDWDYTRFNPEFFHHLEKRISDLMALGIEADLILFHPYDRWGFSEMSAETDDFYLKYIVARLSSYRNVWWSFANEYDLMEGKNEADWDRYFKIVQMCDPYQHLRSIHNCREFYDHGKPWVTHCSVQHQDLSRVSEWITLYQKPVVVDECRYEGTIHHGWGNITGQEMVNKFWEGFVRGGYVGHGETYVHDDDILWWSRGGILHGTSPERIAFLRTIIEDAPPNSVSPFQSRWNQCAGGTEGKYYLYYQGNSQSAYRLFDLPQNSQFTADVIDAWDMTITPVAGTVSGHVRIELPPKPYIAVRFQAVSG